MLNEKKFLFLVLIIVILGTYITSNGMEENMLTWVPSNIKIIINDIAYETDEQIVLINDRTYIPLRTVAEALGARVEYDAISNTVAISLNKELHHPGDDWSCDLLMSDNGEMINPWYVDDNGIVYSCFRDFNGDIALKTNCISVEYYETYASEQEKQWFDALNEYIYIVSDFSNGAAIIAKVSGDEEYCGYMDVYGNEIFFDSYTRIGPFSEGLAKASTMSRNRAWPTYGFINKAGEMVISEKYQWTSFFSEGLCAVVENKGENCYFINSKGEKMFDGKEYIAADWFSEGYCVVKTKGVESPGKNDKYSYIDKTGNRATEEEWDNASAFANGYATVVKDGIKMKINSNFEVVEIVEE